MNRAERNNNPGNLRPSKDNFYAGQVGRDKDGFAVFETEDAGRAALDQDINAKLGRGMSVHDFIEMYAPVKENGQQAVDHYIIAVLKEFNLNSSDDKIENTEENRRRFAQVIAQVESGTKTEQQKPETSMTEQLAGEGLELAGQGVTALGKYVAENPNTAIGIGTGALANKLLGNPAGAAARFGIQSLGSIGQGLAQSLGPQIPKAVGADVASRMFQANPAGSAINRGLQSGLARGAATVGQGLLGGAVRVAAPVVAGAAGAAALPVLGLTAGLGVPAYMMYKNYAKMTPLERQQRLEEAQQAGLPGP